jgi:hypothetical protein
MPLGVRAAFFSAASRNQINGDIRGAGNFVQRLDGLNGGQHSSLCKLSASH